MLRRADPLEAVQNLLQDRIFKRNWNWPFLESLGQAKERNAVLSLLSSAFKKRDQDKVRHLMADFFAGEIVSISDNSGQGGTETDGRENVSRAKLRIDTRKWLMEQLSPERYGSAKGMKSESALRSLFSTKVYLPENGRN